MSKTRTIARMPSAILAASVPETPPPMMVTFAAGVPGTPPSRDASSTRRALQRACGGLDGHSAGDLAHGGEQRKLAVGCLDGLVGNRVDASSQAGTR